jgi:hypothetical protein
MAQAVPDASLIPCVREDGDNWNVTEFNAGTGHARILLEYRLGDAEGATIEVSPRCDMRGAREVSSEHHGVRRYDRDVMTIDRYSSERYYTYPGACTSLRFDLTGRHADLRGAELASVIGFVSRTTLDQQIGEVNDHRLHLDPSSRP